MVVRWPACTPHMALRETRDGNLLVVVGANMANVTLPGFKEAVETFHCALF